MRYTVTIVIMKARTLLVNTTVKNVILVDALSATGKIYLESNSVRSTISWYML